MTTIGYARVSTDGQTLDAQHAALRDAGCERIFGEKESGARTDRARLAKAIAALTAGDTLIVTKLDRLARSTRDLLNTLDAIGKAAASFRSLNDSWANTDTAHGRLMLTVLASSSAIRVGQKLAYFYYEEEAADVGGKRRLVRVILARPSSR
jgi:DNA invertase Pin-like site-specific DNA recombinase